MTDIIKSLYMLKRFSFLSKWLSSV